MSMLERKAFRFIGCSVQDVKTLYTCLENANVSDLTTPMPGFTNSFPFSQVAHPLFGHTLSFRRSVASQTEAFVGHAAGQTTRGVAVGPATLTSGVQVAHIFGLRRAFGGFIKGATKIGKPGYPDGILK